jgi:hypothetical protein
MQTSESIASIAKALSEFQGEVKNPANTADNPFFKSKYAPLSDILNLVRPTLAKYGLSVIQAPSGDGDKIIITTRLMHSSGEWIEACPLSLKADKATAQGAGSAITYGRRYSLAAILGISSEDDDDGNGAETQVTKPVKTTKATATTKPAPTTKPATTEPSKAAHNPPQASRPPSAASTDLISEPQSKKIFAMSKKLHLEADTMRDIMVAKCNGKNSSKTLTKKEASALIEYLTKLENGAEVWTPHGDAYEPMDSLHNPIEFTEDDMVF